MKHTLLLLLCTVLIFGCQKSDEKENKSPRVKTLSRVVQPKYGQLVTLGEAVPFMLEVSGENKLDSIVVKYMDKTILIEESESFTLPPFSSQMGKKDLDLTIYLNGQTTERKRHSLVIKSNQAPEVYGYQIISELPHDENAFTQGLFIADGTMYESTGQNGQSSLRIVDMFSGNVIKKKELADQYFGEGIAKLGGKIYMLTYHAGECFVFDAGTFEQLAMHNYPTEGWGMTVVNDTLVMSDGSEILHFMEPTGFTEVKRIEVYDHEEAIDDLNELEYINGKIYANRWFTDEIYVIDPETGKVEQVIDLTGLLADELRTANTNVLNGIAYDHDKDAIYVTGKYWPRLFEIKVNEKPNNL